MFGPSDQVEDAPTIWVFVRNDSVIFDDAF